ncbi:MAG TPA: cobalamin biosynthesis protein CbiD [Lachnospiraceae bacterium]|nr:cobalamin biosynthesis protein CbiD [Lachnospiraceae bacterium]
MRMGYTTGSCAAAAAKAAATMLFSGQPVEEVPLMTPKGVLLHLNIEDIQMGEETVSCAVRKDGGDDPDVTTGLLVYAGVSRMKDMGIQIDGGIGVGRVTKKGLQQPVGEAAINDTPRRMIREAVGEICRKYQYNQGLRVVISVPGGEKAAEKTFNPRLGIQGGISILGTSGIVVPMSEAALIESIRVEMRMLHANGGGYLVITPGNYGEVFSQEQKNIRLDYAMKCSNYVGETLDFARELGVKGILFIAHIGKFIKVSGGIMNTHSRHADSRAELMAAQAIRAGASLETARKILDTITTEEALDILYEEGLTEAFMEVILPKVAYYLDHRAAGELQLGAILFSSVHGKLGETEGVAELIRRINAQG